MNNFIIMDGYEIVCKILILFYSKPSDFTINFKSIRPVIGSRPRL